MCKCSKCGGINVYELELRTDYNNFRKIEPINENIPELSNEDLPYRMYMYYCNDCEDIVETIDQQEYEDEE